MPRHLPVASLFCSLSVVSSAFPSFFNLGASESWTDSVGQVWEPDNLGGSSIVDCPGPFLSFQDATLLCSRKEWQATSGDIEIPVPARGVYEAKLYFSEANGAVGDRVMDVYVEGVEVFSGVDVVERTGAPTSYYVITVKRFIGDSSFTIRLNASQGNPALAAIQVTADGATPAPAVAPPPQLPTGWAVNVGSSSSFTGTSGKVWQSDILSSGSVIDQCSDFSFLGLDNPDLYCKYRRWAVGGSSGVLDFPVENGFYSVTLYFSETSANAGERVVDIFFEGSKIVTGLDVASQLGSNYGVQMFTISSNIFDRSVSLELRATRGAPVLAAVEILDASVAVPTIIPTMAPTSLPAPVAPRPGPTTQPRNSWNVNIGSASSFTGVSGKTWQPDIFTTGSSIDVCSTFSFVGLDDPNLYCRFRQWAVGGSSGLLEFPVETGFYSVKLYISEISAAAGERVVDIFFEGSNIASGVDVADLIGGSYGIYTFTVSGFIGDGAVSLEIRASSGSPVLAAVEIVEPSGGPIFTPGSSMFTVGSAVTSTVGPAFSSGSSTTVKLPTMVTSMVVVP